MNSGKRLKGLVSEHATLSIISIYNLAVIFVALIFYPLMPVLMGYPPESRQIGYELGASYTTQYLATILPTMVIGTAILLFFMKRIDMWKKLLIENTDSGNSTYILDKIRKGYINIPYIIFVAQFILLIPLVIVLIVVHFISNVPFQLLYKIIMVTISFNYLTSVLSYTFSKKILGRILFETFKGGSLQGQRIGLRTKIFIQIIPMVIVAIMFTSLLGYSRLIKEKGDLIYLLGKDKLAEQVKSISKAENRGQVFNILKNIKISGVNIDYFLIDADDKIIHSNVSDFTGYFKYYIKHPYKGDRLYGDTYEVQGVLTNIDGKLGKISVGIKFKVASQEIVWVIGAGFLGILALTIFILFTFSKGVADDLKIVARSIDELAEGKDVDLRKRIPVTSNDEIGDLVAAFNRIQDREYEYDKLRDEFFSNISHELRTPINIILTTIQFIEKYLIDKIRDEETSKLKKHMETMKKNGYRLLKLVNNIIDSTRIDIKFFNVNMYNCDIVGIVRETTNSAADYIIGKGLDIRFETDVDKVKIACDPDLIERVMLNLLSNAVKFTDKGGKIIVSLHETGGFVNISVKDNGIGIEKDKQSLVFERFRQIEEPLKRSYEGSGIGLSLVKAFVEMHGGSVSLDSEWGKGSVFTVRLPVQTLPSTADSQEQDEKVDRGVEMVNIEMADIK